MSREILLETRNLAMHFGGVVANEGVNFTLEKGELRCLIGPNGAGKSTFFKCLTGQLTPTEGSVRIGDVDTTGYQPHEIARLGVGIKTQIPNVFDGLSVEQNVWLSASRRQPGKSAVSIANEMLERLRLSPLRSRQVGMLAHGQRQWVELAMVMATQPRLVLLDEPAAGMTDEETLLTAELIREINQTASLIIVEHDMNFIRAIADKVTVFYRGKILIEDTMDAISANTVVRDVYLGHKH